VPKVERAEDLQDIERLLDELGATMGIQALVETAAGLLRVGEIAEASRRLDALILGYEDMAASLCRVRRSTSRTPNAYRRHARQFSASTPRRYWPGCWG